MIDTLIFAVILLFVNLIFCYKPIPIFSFPIGIFSIFIFSTQLLTDSDLPLQPYFSVFVIIVCVSSITINALDFKGGKK